MYFTVHSLGLPLSAFKFQEVLHITPKDLAVCIEIRSLLWVMSAHLFSPHLHAAVGYWKVWVEPRNRQGLCLTFLLYSCGLVLGHSTMAHELWNLYLINMVLLSWEMHCRWHGFHSSLLDFIAAMICALH